MTTLALASGLTYLFSGVLLVCLFVSYARKRPRYPPGPKGLPLIRNLLDIPADYPWITYRDLAEKYNSDILHFEVFGSHLVVLNSAEATRQILEKQSSITSDRAHSVMLNELSGWDTDRTVTFMEYGDSWRRHRKLFQEHFRQQAIPRYHHAQTKGVNRLLKSLLDTPEKFSAHIRFMSAYTITEVVFGKEVEPDDPSIEVVDDGMHTLNELLNAGVFLVDIFPLLRYVPSWLPGASFKRLAGKWKKAVDDMYTIPYNNYKATLGEGDANTCLLATAMADKVDQDDARVVDHDLMCLAGTTFGAGYDTTATALGIFIMVMAVHPEAQISIHEELDRVLHRDRLPAMEDRKELPRTTALMYETFRWHLPLPLGVPHQTTAAIHYNGYFIPQGTNIVANSWAILRDEGLYPDPETFRPERWLNADGSLRNDMRFPVEMFGYGRRICVGRHFAEDIVWLAIASILAVYKIEPPVDENGTVRALEADFTPRLFSAPKPFKCRFTPRFPGAESLIRASV
uniref:Cytochrome P450 n=1 Tax=Phanerodontia chrysosporium TaxID=2822231 RepID=G5EJN3_PHACH|nr:cytochrome P450 [Phanerodontia chrysosporium]